MEVHISTDLEAKLIRIAAEQGRDSHSLVTEAIERMVDYDDWFLREVDQGVAAGDRGEFVEHDEIRAQIERRFPV